MMEEHLLPPADLVIEHAEEVITCAMKGSDPVGRIRDGGVAVGGERILAVGTTQEVRSMVDVSSARIIDASGCVIAPGFVDSHTHVVFGGSRVQEYAARLTHTKEEVRAMGIPTGITATMAMTRLASEDELLDSAAERLWGMLRHGTTTVESKSGYGLSLPHELKMLRVNRMLPSRVPLDVISTFLGAHAFPPDTSPESYVSEIVHEMLPAVREEWLAEFCDVYIDDGYFNLAQTRLILEAGRAAGLKLKIHADQYGALGGSALAAELGLVSADHLNFTSPETMERLARAGVVGVLMPMIDFAVKHPRPFDAVGMRQAGMTIALATDMCPGGWTESMQLVMQFAGRVHGFSPEEALLAATVGGAQALDLHDRGLLAPGMLADLQVWNVPCLEDVMYRLGVNEVKLVIKRGKLVVSSL